MVFRPHVGNKLRQGSLTTRPDFFPSPAQRGRQGGGGASLKGILTPCPVAPLAR